MGSVLAGGGSSLLKERRAAGGRRGAPETSQGIQILLFDTFGTVVDWRSSVIAEGETLGRAKGLKVHWAAFADAWRAGYAPAMNRVRTGELPWTKLDVLHRMTLDELLVRFQIEGLSDDEKVHFNRAWHRLHPWPDAVEGLTRLRKVYVIAPLSNGNLSLLTNMAKFAGLPWDCILSTELVRHYKPDKETYLMASELFDIPPGAVMMVAAHYGDLQAAQKLGLKTAYVSRPLEFGAAATRPSVPRTEAGFDFRADDFLELASQLGA
jgi:2-haloacid dehalogenase